MKVKGSHWDQCKNILSVLLVVGMFLYLGFNWSNFPEKIPGHYNAMGVVDRWGDKVEIVALPLVAVLLYSVITVIEQFPSIWNTGVTLSEENKDRVYGTLKSMIVTEKFLVCGIFAYLFLKQATAEALPTLFLPIFFVLMFGSLAYYFVKLFKAK